MLHTKFRDNQFWRRLLKGFYHIWAWRPSWSCDPDAANKISSPYPRRLHIKFGFDRPSSFGEEDFLKIVDGPMTAAGALVSYKLTYEPSAQMSSQMKKTFRETPTSL